MDPLSPPEFAEMVQRLNRAAKAAGMKMPSFVSPPRAPSATRTIRWLAPDRALVAVRRGSRTADAVVGDMIDGVIAANGLTGEDANDLRIRLQAAATVISMRPTQVLEQLDR